MRRLFPILGSLLLALPALAGYTFPVGEKAVYKIRWGMLTCGTSTITCSKVETEGAELIRIRVRVKSNWLISTVYPVDDTVDCFIDPVSGQSVRVEKDTSEGDTICRDVLTIDRENNRAYWVSHSDNITTNYPVSSGACDAISFLYAFRQDELTKGESQRYSLIVDTAEHGITVSAGPDKKIKAGELGKLNCRRYLVIPQSDGLFVRKIPEEIWLTADDRQLMTRMDVKVPVGTARIVLDEYVPPESD